MGIMGFGDLDGPYFGYLFERWKYGTTIVVLVVRYYHYDLSLADQSVALKVVFRTFNLGKETKTGRRS